MEKKVVLQVFDEGDGLHFQFDGKRHELFDAIGCMLGGLHYTDIKKGICVKESMADIRVRVIRAMRKSFDIAHEKCKLEIENEKSKDNS